MDIPAGWAASPSAFRWGLLFHFDDLASNAGRWFRMTSNGNIAAFSFPKGTGDCSFSPGGTRALAILNSPSDEGRGRWTTRARSILDLRSGVEMSIEFAADSDIAWSRGELQIAYWRHPSGWQRRGDGSILAARNLDSGLVREVHARDIWCLRWHPDGRELIAITSSRWEFFLARFAANELSQIDESPLAIEFTANDPSISPDAEFISFCDDSPDDEEYCAYTYRLADGLVMPIGPHLIDASLAWSPSGHRLAFRASAGEGDDLHKTVTIFDPRTRESIETVPINSGDDAGEISGPDPAWSPDGGLIAFASYEEEGSAIYVADASSGKSEKVLQTKGLVHSLGFVAIP